MELKTISRIDPLIKAYLTGSFSKDHVALPVRPMHARDMNLVTFKIVLSQNLQKPNMLLILLKAFRIDLLGLTIMPFLASLLYFFGSLTPEKLPLVGLALVSMVLVHCSVFSFNDYFDHFKGGDRMNPNSGSQVIQQGWLRAQTVFRLSLGLLLFAVLSAVPIVAAFPLKLLPVAAVVMASSVGYSLLGQGFKYRGIGEFFVFICFGPLIFYGTSVLLGTSLTLNALFVSIVFAWMTVFYQQVKNFENIYVDSQLRIGTFISRIGFDNAKVILQLQSIVLCALFAVFAYKLFAVDLGVVSLLLLGGMVFIFLRKLKTVDSPMSGRLLNLSRYALLLHHAFFVLLVAQLYFGAVK